MMDTLSSILLKRQVYNLRWLCSFSWEIKIFSLRILPHSLWCSARRMQDCGPESSFHVSFCPQHWSINICRIAIGPYCLAGASFKARIFANSLIQASWKYLSNIQIVQHLQHYWGYWCFIRFPEGETTATNRKKMRLFFLCRPTVKRQKELLA